jgi:hypothetical protein
LLQVRLSAPDPKQMLRDALVPGREVWSISASRKNGRIALAMRAARLLLPRSQFTLYINSSPLGVTWIISKLSGADVFRFLACIGVPIGSR